MKATVNYPAHIIVKNPLAKPSIRDSTSHKKLCLVVRNKTNDALIMYIKHAHKACQDSQYNGSLATL